MSDLLEPRFGVHSLRFAMIAMLATMAFGVVALLRGSRTLLRDLERNAG